MYTKKKRKMRGGEVKPSEMSTAEYESNWYQTLKNAIHQEYGGGGVRKSRRRKKRRQFRGGASWPNTQCSPNMEYGEAVKKVMNAPMKMMTVAGGEKACLEQANYINSFATSKTGNPSSTQVGAGRGKRHRKNGNNKRKTVKKHKKKLIRRKKSAKKTKKGGTTRRWPKNTCSS